MFAITFVFWMPIQSIKVYCTMITLKSLNIGIEDLPNEFWKYVPNTDNRYLISNQGRLLTLNFKNSKRASVMRPATNQNGYLHTLIVSEGKLKKVVIHRLVAQTWIENPLNKAQVNHINFIRNDNRIENLEWCTPQENTLHSYNNGRIKMPKNAPPMRGSKNGGAKLNEEQVREIRMKFKPYKYTREMLAKEYGVKANTIKDAILRSWKHVQ
jgi:hypothetical protein